MFKSRYQIYDFVYLVILEISLWMIPICSAKLTECRIKTPDSKREIKCHQYEGNDDTIHDVLHEKVVESGCSRSVLLQRNEVVCDKVFSRIISGFDVRPIQEKSPFPFYNPGFKLTFTIPQGGSTNRRNYLITYQSNSDITRCVVIEEIHTELYTGNRTKDVEILIKILPVKGRTAFKFTIELLCHSQLKFPTTSLTRWGNSGNENWRESTQQSTALSQNEALRRPSSSWRTTVTYLVKNRTIKIWFVKAPDKYKFREYSITLRRITPNGIFEEKNRISEPVHVFEDVPPGRYRIGIEPYDDQWRSFNSHKCKKKYGNPQVCTVSKTDIIEIRNNSVFLVPYEGRDTNGQNKTTLHPVVIFGQRTTIKNVTKQRDRSLDVTTEQLKMSESTVSTTGDSSNQINTPTTTILTEQVKTSESTVITADGSTNQINTPTTTILNEQVKTSESTVITDGGSTNQINTPATTILTKQVKKNQVNIVVSRIALLTSILGMLCILVVIVVFLGVNKLYRKGCAAVICTQKTKTHNLHNDKTPISHKAKETQILSAEHTHYEASNEYHDSPHTNGNQHIDIYTSHDCSKFLNKKVRSDSGYKSQNQCDMTDDEEWQEAGQSLIIDQILSNQQNYVDNVYSSIDEVSIVPAITIAEGHAGQHLTNPDQYDEIGIPYSGIPSEISPVCNCYGNEYMLQYCIIQDKCCCRCERMERYNTAYPTINYGSFNCMSSKHDNILPKDIDFICIPPEDSIDGSICTADQMDSIREINNSSLTCPVPEQTDTISGISV